MPKKTILACAVCLLIGVGIGMMLSIDKRAGVPESALFPEKKREFSQKNSFSWNREMEMAPPTAGNASSSKHNLKSAIAKFPVDQGMVIVPRDLISELSIAAGTRTNDQELFSPDGRIEKILQITDYEKARVQTAWLASRKQIRDLESKVMQSEEIDEWSMKITVPDLSTQMASLGAKFRDQAHAVLGENRAESLISAKQIDRTFAPPEGDKTYIFSTEETGDGNWRYRFELDGPLGRRVWVGENVPEELKHIAKAVKLSGVE